VERRPAVWSTGEDGRRLPRDGRGARPALTPVVRGGLGRGRKTAVRGAERGEVGLGVSSHIAALSDAHPPRQGRAAPLSSRPAPVLGCPHTAERSSATARARAPPATFQELKTMSMGLSKQLGLLGFSGSDHPSSAERRSSDSRARL
jgi:hypothetical protein